jgi:hypothetical protein
VISPRILLVAGLSLVTLGMALVAIGVLSASLFYPGVYLILAGTLGIAGAGVWFVARPPETD